MERAFTAQGDLDAMRDNLAVQVFTMKALLDLPEIGGKEGSHYLFPFVYLCHAIWDPHLSPETRVALLSITGKKLRNVQTGSSKDMKTFWRRSICSQEYNLCAALCWVMVNFGPTMEFAQRRIGSHPVECSFAIPRSMLSNETRWKSFSSVQARRVMRDLDVQLDIFRFLNYLMNDLMSDSMNETINNVINHAMTAICLKIARNCAKISLKMGQNYPRLTANLSQNAAKLCQDDTQSLSK
jgi:hypothetical protein